MITPNNSRFLYNTFLIWPDELYFNPLQSCARRPWDMAFAYDIAWGCMIMQAEDNKKAEYWTVWCPIGGKWLD